MCRDLVGDLVALEHVLQRRDPEAELLGQPQQHQDLVGAIAVRVHEALALEDLHERLELQIAPGFDGRRVLLSALDPGRPRGLVRLRTREGVANHELDAHSAGRIPPRTLLAELPHVLRVLAERELDAWHRARELEVVAAGLAPAQLDHQVLAADRVCAAVQHVGRRDAAGQVPVDVVVGGVEDVLDARHRAHRRPAFVDRVGGDVGVRVDDAGRYEPAFRVDDLGARGHVGAGAHRCDTPAFDDDGARGDRALGDSEDCGVGDGDDRRGSGLSVRGRCRRAYASHRHGYAKQYSTRGERHGSG